MKNGLKVAVLSLCAFFLVGLAGAASGSSVAGPVVGMRTLTVTGAGAVSAVPNEAQFSFGLTSAEKTATQALAVNAVGMQKVIAALKRAGIAARDIQTQTVSLDPRFSESGDEILGYRASSSVSASLRTLSRAGRIVDAAVGAGANQVSGPSLTRRDRAALYRAALRAAVANAVLKARAIAAAGHVKLGRIRSVTEGSMAPPTPIPEKAAAPSTSTPIEAGTQLVEGDVVVEFALR